jgi:hypothetical protein
MVEISYRNCYSCYPCYSNVDGEKQVGGDPYKGNADDLLDSSLEPVKHQGRHGTLKTKGGRDSRKIWTDGCSMRN